tara:strand:- start:273 stop:437 length:165 start_codon:yes stop_codon:yes gene_type:complete
MKDKQMISSFIWAPVFLSFCWAPDKIKKKSRERDVFVFIVENGIRGHLLTQDRL